MLCDAGVNRNIRKIMHQLHSLGISIKKTTVITAEWTACTARLCARYAVLLRRSALLCYWFPVRKAHRTESLSYIAYILRCCYSPTIYLQSNLVFHTAARYAVTRLGYYTQNTMLVDQQMEIKKGKRRWQHLSLIEYHLSVFVMRCTVADRFNTQHTIEWDWKKPREMKSKFRAQMQMRSSFRCDECIRSFVLGRNNGWGTHSTVSNCHISAPPNKYDDVTYIANNRWRWGNTQFGSMEGFRDVIMTITLAVCSMFV